jgi:EpsI family protein
MSESHVHPPQPAFGPDPPTLPTPAVTPAEPTTRPRSRGPSLLQLGSVVGILAAGLVLTALTSAVDKVSAPGIRVVPEQQVTEDGRTVPVERPFLPDQAGDWTGGTLEGLSEAERKVLPKDTQGARRLYRRADGTELFCSIILAGRDVTSIHRPELCLPGQGWRYVEWTETIPVASAPLGKLEVMRMNALRNARLEGGQTVTIPSVFTYWFVGKDRFTARHWQRMFWTTKDRVLHNMNHRWAYVLIHVPPPSRETASFQQAQDEAMEIARQFIPDIFAALAAD